MEMSDNMKNLSFDKLDVLMVLLVGEELSERMGDNYYNILIDSPFLDKLNEDPYYVHYYDPVYWTKWIVDWYDNQN